MFSSALSVAAPGGVSLSSFFKEMMGNSHSILSLASHFLNEALCDFLSHMSNSSLSSSGFVSKCVSLFPGWIKMNLATWLLSTMSRVEVPWSIIVPWVLTIKALNKCFGIARVMWFSPLGKVINEFTSTSNNSNLSSSDVINHSFGSIVEMFSNFLNFWCLWFVFEPLSPMHGVILYSSPVIGCSNCSIVIGVINMDTHFFKLALVMSMWRSIVIVVEIAFLCLCSLSVSTFSCIVRMVVSIFWVFITWIVSPWNISSLLIEMVNMIV